MKADVTTNNPWLKPVCALLFILTLIGIFTTPLTNSHYFRQAQTAQGAQIFLEEGWNPFAPKLRFTGRPGYNFLEFPIYQSLTSFVSAGTGLDVVYAGRLLSLLSAVAFVFACLRILQLLDGRFRILQWKFALLLLSSPLLFASMQWVNIETLNIALAAWSFYLALEWLHKKPRIAALARLLACSALSISLKPTAIFAISPLFLWVWLQLFKNDRRKSVHLALTLACGAALGFAWVVFAEYSNRKYSAEFRVGAQPMHYFGLNLNAAFFSRLAGRVTLYVLGPATALWCGYKLLTGLRRNDAGAMQFRAFLFSIAGPLLYLSVFSHLNFIHNYYQLYIILPLFLSIYFLGVLTSLLQGTKVLLAVVVINVLVSYGTLIKPDRDLGHLMDYWKKSLPAGHHSKPILVISDIRDYVTLLSYSNHIYTEHLEIDRLQALPVAEEKSPVFICDSSRGHECLKKAQSLKPSCLAAGINIGRFWICGP